MSTLSVAISTMGSSTSTLSPSALSQRVMVPSVTDSPRAGMTISVPPPPDRVSTSGFWAGASAAVLGASAGVSAWAAGTESSVSTGAGCGAASASAPLSCFSSSRTCGVTASSPPGSPALPAPCDPPVPPEEPDPPASDSSPITAS